VAEDDWCSINEAARRLCVTPTAIRNRIKRGTLEHRPNGNVGKLVRVPLTVLEPVLLTVTPTVPEPLGGTVPSGADGTIKALEAHVQTMRELLDERNVAHIAEMARLLEERAQLQDELQEARAEADHAKSDQVRMARDVAIMFDELKALADRHAELHADRARLQADVERLAAELEQARRPWWWRLVGR
jgi:multidrug efflux pump subunit AcrA (membrane-fusion protein)